jgi:hypothetical protein
MKQTPIPEKIDINLVGCLLTPSTINSINSLIDVLTEQQKEIDLLKQMRTHDMSDHLLEWHIVEKTQPYTAMRSTGKLVAKYKINGDTKLGKSAKIEYADRRSTGDYCVCKEPSICGFKRHDGNDICIQCGEYIKPQEDVTYSDEAIKIQKIILETSHYTITSNEAMETADRILAIVKGE